MRAAAMADGGFGARGERRYGTEGSMLSKGRGSVTHDDDEGTLGEVGDGPEPANLTKMASGSEVEDDGDGGDAGLPKGCGSVGRKRGSRRSSWVHRRG